MSLLMGRPLWLGSAWTLLAAGLLYLLTPLANAGASGFFALLLVAAGWAVVGRATAVPQPSANRLDDEERRLRAEFIGLLNECVRQFSFQYSAMKAEIGRIQALLAEAIATLSDAFEVIHGQASLQAPAIAEAHAQGMASQVSRAVIALQFHDLVSQLTGHMLLRIEALDAVAVHLGQLTHLLRSDANQAAATIAALKRDADHVATLLAEMELRTLHVPVNQQAMSHGGVELF